MFVLLVFGHVLTFEWPSWFFILTRQQNSSVFLDVALCFKLLYFPLILLITPFPCMNFSGHFFSIDFWILICCYKQFFFWLTKAFASLVWSLCWRKQFLLMTFFSVIKFESSLVIFNPTTATHTWLCISTEILIQGKPNRGTEKIVNRDWQWREIWQNNIQKVYCGMHLLNK